MRQNWDEFDITKLKEVEDRFILSISIKDNLVYLVYEIYVP